MVSPNTRLLCWRVRSMGGFIGRARVARLMQLDLVIHPVSQFSYSLNWQSKVVYFNNCKFYSLMCCQLHFIGGNCVIWPMSVVNHAEVNQLSLILTSEVNLESLVLNSFSLLKSINHLSFILNSSVSWGSNWSLPMKLALILGHGWTRLCVSWMHHWSHSVKGKVHQASYRMMNKHNDIDSKFELFVTMVCVS